MPATLQKSLQMHWWCHHTWHQRHFFFECSFFWKTAGTNSSFVAEKLKINQYSLSPSPPSFTIWVYIIFNKAPTKLWTPGWEMGCASATLCRWKWMASLKPCRTVCRSFSNPRRLSKTLRIRSSRGNKVDGSLCIIQFQPVLFWSRSLYLSLHISLGVRVLYVHIQREWRRKGVNN